ncbi:unnamed protein product [Linum tenue]|uniref:Response regulatory domain-containing protein n=1 Tax=Linum tenue TaxID=586396 RepID=A0AAV0PM88_9ROSI|nr:unnamed protein product [Linum tenue]
MIYENDFSTETNETAEDYSLGVSILLLDCDSVCSTILSKMLRASGYTVTTAKLAKEALYILQHRQGEIDLVLTELYLPDMGKYELLETIREISTLPVVVLSSDISENVMLGCLFKGAAFYIPKPVIMQDIKNLWQFSFMTRQNSLKKLGRRTSKCPEMPLYENNARECKRKEAEWTESSKDCKDYCMPQPKKSKIIWTPELHAKFLRAVNLLGVDPEPTRLVDARPKKILEYMKVPELSKANISSHLQKHRLSLTRLREELEMAVLRGNNAASPHFRLLEGRSLSSSPVSLTRIAAAASTCKTPTFHNNTRSTPILGCSFGSHHLTAQVDPSSQIISPRPGLNSVSLGSTTLQLRQEYLQPQQQAQQPAEDSELEQILLASVEDFLLDDQPVN